VNAQEAVSQHADYVGSVTTIEDNPLLTHMRTSTAGVA